MSDWIHCIICKNEDLHEEDIFDDVVSFICSNCGFIHNFHEPDFHYDSVVESQNKAKEEMQRIDETLDYIMGDISDLEDEIKKKRNE